MKMKKIRGDLTDVPAKNPHCSPLPLMVKSHSLRVRCIVNSCLLGPQLRELAMEKSSHLIMCCSVLQRRGKIEERLRLIKLYVEVHLKCPMNVSFTVDINWAFLPAPNEMKPETAASAWAHSENTSHHKFLL